ncbi:MAG: ATP--cob(I)alamin adenosyltransferase [Thermodesulfobacteriota bacterium]|nr:MAG: ATP--cob(I)alamin adenosyltransferase [Thermodesulfobacteriota bacterium]
MSKKRITKVYTKTGDKGLTSLVGGERVSKASLRVDSYGDVDELNAVLGIIRSQGVDKEINALIIKIQNDLFVMGADLASPMNIEVPRVSAESIENLEIAIDQFLEELEPLKEFILPSGNTGGSYLHFARTVSRRAERKVVKLMDDEEIGENVLIYLNRLSDLLFVMARVENQRGSFKETFVDFNK